MRPRSLDMEDAILFSYAQSDAKVSGAPDMSIGVQAGVSENGRMQGIALNGVYKGSAFEMDPTTGQWHLKEGAKPMAIDASGMSNEAVAEIVRGMKKLPGWTQRITELRNVAVEQGYEGQFDKSFEEIMGESYRSFIADNPQSCPDVKPAEDDGMAEYRRRCGIGE
jgi:hypothetical protein